MARSTKDGDPLLMGYVPAPPGAVDPLDAPAQKTPTAPPPDAPANKPLPGTAHAGSEPLADDLPADDESDDAPPFEDELAPPSTPKRSLSLPPERMEPVTPPLRLEDPRDLARRLAEEARQKAVANKPATPEPAPTASAPKKSGLAAKAPPPQAPAPAPAPAPAASAAAPAAPQPERKRSLAERAARPVSAQDALRAAQEAAAREEEAAKAKRKAAKDAAKAAQQAVKAAAVAQEAATRAGAAAPPAPAPAPSPAAAPTTDLAALLAKGVAGAGIEREIVVQNAVVFRALWTAHRARAQATRDLHLLATASVLLDAADRLPQGCLVAAQLNVGDRSVAVWADLARGVILGFAEPPEIYLAGL